MRLLISLAACLLAAATPCASEKGLEEALGNLLLRAVSLLVGQKYLHEDSTPASFKKYALSDTSNDEIADFNLEQIIERSGFQYESHNITSLDGYITTLLRLVNPRADQRRLKQPPLMMVNGAITDHRVWVWPSAIQHFPEPWPRSPQDGPMRSWNRSLAFALANNGFDVWIAGTRGSNEQNKGHVRYNARGDLFGGCGGQGSATGARAAGDRVEEDDGHQRLMERIAYWNYSMDEMARYELPHQIDQVLKLTGARNISLCVQSFSSTISLMMLADQPEYQKRLHSSVFLIPIINNRGTNLAVKAVQQLFKLIPIKLGTVIVTEILLSQAIRCVARAIASSRQLRYTIYKAFLLVAGGPSAKYRSLLEPEVHSNILMPTSFKEAKHWSQIVTAARLQHYDYGPSMNKKLYGSLKPAPYNLSELDLGNWLQISAQYDVLATPSSAQQFMSLSKTPPVEQIVVPDYSHLEVLAALDNDAKIVRPTVDFFNRFHLPAPADDDDEEEEGGRRRFARESDRSQPAKAVDGRRSRSFVSAGQSARGGAPIPSDGPNEARRRATRAAVGRH